MKRLLRKIKRILDKIFGTIIDEIYWRFRHLLGNKNWPQTYVSKESLNHPHRQFLIKKISACQFENILEIGCASGPNLYLLSKKFPDVKIYGTDISKEAIKFGEKWLNEQNIKNVFLSVAKADNLKKFSDKSIDIIFTDATLIYLSPRKIKKSLKEIIRVAKKALILNEWHTETDKSLYKDHWAHNYKLIFKELLPEEKIKISKIPKELWAGEWSEYGYIIEAELN